MINLFNGITEGSTGMLPGFSTRARIAFTVANCLFWGTIAFVLIAGDQRFIGSLLVATSLTTGLFGLRIWRDAREAERTINASVSRAMSWYGMRIACEKCGQRAHILDPSPTCPRCGYGGEPQPVPPSES